MGRRCVCLRSRSENATMKLAEIIDNHLIITRTSRKTFAEEVGLNQSTVTRFLNGKGLNGEGFALLMIWMLKP